MKRFKFDHNKLYLFGTQSMIYGIHIVAIATRPVNLILFIIIIIIDKKIYFHAGRCISYIYYACDYHSHSPHVTV